jgi:hypothetical protein
MNSPSPERQSPWAGRITLAFAALMTIVAILQRSFPHPFNLTLIGALGLWGAARLRPSLGLALPLVVWGITEVIELKVQGHASFNALVGAGFFAYGLLGLLLRRTNSPARIGVTCLLGSVQFFLLTNFAAWLAMSVDPSQVPGGLPMVKVSRGAYDEPIYARNLPGLLACYAEGLPFSNPDAPPLGFFGNLLLGDLPFTALLFGLHAGLLWVLAPFPQRAREVRP